MFNIKNVKLNKFVGGLLIATSFVAGIMTTNVVNDTYGAKLNEIGIVVNNKEVNLTNNTGKPFVQDNRTFVPIRVVTEKKWFSLEELKVMIDNNEIIDGKTIISILKLLGNL